MSRVRGFRDVYIAEVLKNTETEYVCNNPIKLFKAISGKINVKRNSEKTYADDAVDEIIDSFEAVEVELEGDALTMEKIALLRSAKLDKGVLTESIEDETKEIALGFRVKTKGGKYNFHWYYCGKFDGEDSDEFETQADKPAPKTKTLKGTFYGRNLADSNGKHAFRKRIHEEELTAEDADAKTALENWFKKVPDQTTETSNTDQTEQTT